jgi:hypothetical protein
MLDAVSGQDPQGDGCGCLLLKEAETWAERAQEREKYSGWSSKHLADILIATVGSYDDGAPTVPRSCGRVGILTSDGDYSSMPYRTLGINVTRSFLVGLVLALLTAKRDLSPSWRYLISIGFIGGYAIFSTSL